MVLLAEALERQNPPAPSPVDLDTSGVQGRVAQGQEVLGGMALGVVRMTSRTP